MHREYVSRSAGFEEVLGALLKILFIRSERIYQQGLSKIEPDRSSALMREFRLALEQNFRALQSVRDYANLLKISPDRLGKAVRERSGRSAGEFIRQRLLLEAQRLLAHTEMAVSEIAYALNFQDPAYFSRFFRRLASQSPGEFREGLSDKYQELPPRYQSTTESQGIRRA